MSEWKLCTLGEISTDISYGYTASASKEECGPKFLRITDIVPDRINWDTVPYCSIEDKKIEKYNLETGDIVIARTGATTGYNKLIIKNNNSVFASYLIRYRINSEVANPYYVAYNLQSYEWKGFVEGIIGGSAQPGANAKQFASFDLLLPPLKEQKAIAEVLSSLDDKIDLLHRQNKTLEALAQTLFREWFIEEAKDEWEECKLSDILEIKYGKDHKKLANGNIPVYGSGGIMRYADSFLYDKESILIPRKGTLTNLFYIDEPFWTVDTLFWSKVNSKRVSGKFLFSFLKTMDLSNLNVGSAVPSLTTKVLNEIKILLPSLDEQREFNEYADNAWVKIKSNLQQIKTLENMRDTLLPKLMSGEVRVENG